MKDFWPFWTIGGILVLILGFVVTDCSSGTSRRYDCTISGRNKVDAWIEMQVTTDSDGDIHVSTIHHPDEYYLFCDNCETHETIRVSATMDQYSVITNGQWVTVRSRKGRWTNTDYLARITPE